jgi:hypothetical protein
MPKKPVPPPRQPLPASKRAQARAQQQVLAQARSEARSQQAAQQRAQKAVPSSQVPPKGKQPQHVWPKSQWLGIYGPSLHGKSGGSGTR